MKWYILVIVLTATGCAPYPYPVLRGEDMLPDQYPYTFVFFGDNRPEQGSEQPQVFVEMIDRINREGPLFVVGGGDFVFEGTPADFEAFLSLTKQLNAPVFYVCGNHDDSPYYTDYLGERVYAFTYRNSLFVVLDNSRKVIDERQLVFLELLLKRKREHAFVFVHMPPFDPEGTYTMLHPEAFMSIVSRYDVDVVCSSHIHGFYARERGHTTYFISGGGGSPLRRGVDHHFLLIHVGEDITYEVVS